MAKTKRLSTYKRYKKRLFKKSQICHWCRIQLTTSSKKIRVEPRIMLATIDHVIPLAKGGANLDENMVLSCQPCNVAKGDDSPNQLTKDI